MSAYHYNENDDCFGYDEGFFATRDELDLNDGFSIVAFRGKKRRSKKTKK